MKSPIASSNTTRCSDLIALASELTRGIPRELRPSLAASIRDQCISTMTMLALREAGSSLAPDAAELLSRLTAIQIMVGAAHAKRMIAERAVHRLAKLLDQIRHDVVASLADTSPLAPIRMPPSLTEQSPATPTALGGQAR